MRFGFEKKAWNDEQLRALSRSLAKDRCVASVAHALRAETAGVVNWVDQERVPFYKMFPTSPRPTGTWKDWVEKGKAAMQGIQFACTRERNLLNYSQIMLDYLRCADASGERIYPKESAAQVARLNSMTPSAVNLLAAIAVPNFTKAFETSAKNQTLADEAMLACGLERFHHVNGHYPETLQELVPKYISKVPKDIVTGDILKYRRTTPDNFLLYGVGINETDEGGIAALDWVWNVSGEK